MTSRPLVTPKSLRAAARRQLGVEDFGDDLYEEPLHVLTEAIVEEAGIEPIRLARTSLQLALQLGLRARIARALAAHPEVRETPIEAPIFITGLPRTGTTLLHNLLAGHPSHRCALHWELRSPVRPPGADPSWERSAIAEAEAALGVLAEAVPQLAAIHPMSATAPDECSWLFRPNFASLVYACRYRVPSYFRWLTSIDMEPYYRAYRDCLQLMARQRPGPPRWVLKDPGHLWHLDALAATFGGARVIVLHRAMEEVLPSMASLLHTLHSLESSQRDPQRMAPYVSEMAERGIYGMMQLRGVLRGVAFLDLDYRELVREPRRALERICEFTGSSRRPEELDSMLAWVVDNPQHKFGRHEYSLEQFGLDRSRIRAQFARYEARYLDPSR